MDRVFLRLPNQNLRSTLQEYEDTTAHHKYRSINRSNPEEKKHSPHHLPSTDQHYNHPKQETNLLALLHQHCNHPKQPRCKSPQLPNPINNKSHIKPCPPLTKTRPSRKIQPPLTPHAESPNSQKSSRKPGSSTPLTLRHQRIRSVIKTRRDPTWRNLEPSSPSLLPSDNCLPLKYTLAILSQRKGGRGREVRFRGWLVGMKSELHSRHRGKRRGRRRRSRVRFLVLLTGKTVDQSGLRTENVKGRRKGGLGDGFAS